MPNIDGWTGWKENGGSGGVGRKGGYLSGPLNAFGSQRLVAADHILVDVVRHARRVLQMVGHARSRIRECPFWKKKVSVSLLYNKKLCGKMVIIFIFVHWSKNVVGC